MTYRYRRIITADDAQSFPTAFSEMYNGRGRDFYVSLLTLNNAIGRPLKPKARRRWFEEADNPDQRWLPFEEYRFAKVLFAEPMAHNRAWTLECETAPHRRHRYFWARDLVGRDRALRYYDRGCELLALEVYQRTRVREQARREPENPFVALNFNEPCEPLERFSANSEAHWSIGNVPVNFSEESRNMSGTLRTVLEHSWIRQEIKEQLGVALGTDEPLALDPETGIVHCRDGSIVIAKVNSVNHRLTFDGRNEYIFDCSLSPYPSFAAHYTVLVQDPAVRARNLRDDGEYAREARAYRSDYLDDDRIARFARMYGGGVPGNDRLIERERTEENP